MDKLVEIATKIGFRPFAICLALTSVIVLTMEWLGRPLSHAGILGAFVVSTLVTFLAETLIRYCFKPKRHVPWVMIAAVFLGLGGCSSSRGNVERIGPGTLTVHHMSDATADVDRYEWALLTEGEMEQTGLALYSYVVIPNPSSFQHGLEIYAVTEGFIRVFDRRRAYSGSRRKKAVIHLPVTGFEPEDFLAASRAGIAHQTLVCFLVSNHDFATSRRIARLLDLDMSGVYLIALSEPLLPIAERHRDQTHNGTASNLTINEEIYIADFRGRSTDQILADMEAFKVAAFEGKEPDIHATPAYIEKIAAFFESIGRISLAIAGKDAQARPADEERDLCSP